MWGFTDPEPGYSVKVCKFLSSASFTLIYLRRYLTMSVSWIKRRYLNTLKSDGRLIRAGE